MHIIGSLSLFHESQSHSVINTPFRLWKNGLPTPHYCRCHRKTTNHKLSHVHKLDPCNWLHSGYIYIPYFPVDNAQLMCNPHPVFSVLTNFCNRYRAPYVYHAPENTWNRTTGCGQARILVFYAPGPKKMFPLLICSFSVMCKQKKKKKKNHRKLTKDKMIQNKTKITETEPL
jgi:hypothetical protein